jgi:hypothetical protein
MRVRDVTTLVLLGVTMVIAGSCQRSIFRQYEYEEEVYLKLDGSATVMVNSSIAALVALRGLDLNPDPSAWPDRDKIRGLYGSQSPAVRVTRVSRPWRRSGRLFVHVRLDVDDIRQLPKSAPFAWSTYQFSVRGQQYHYLQVLGPSAGKAVPNVNWDGTEIVAVRMHLPSKIEHHNTKKIDRGNIVGWEQPLKDRLAGKPLEMEVRMQTQSILYRTLTIFGLALAAALALMAAIVVWVKKKGAPPEAKQA